MTTKSHQPEFVAEIIGKTLDHLIAATWTLEATVWPR